MSDDDEDVWRRDDVVKPHHQHTHHNGNGNGSGDIDDIQKQQKNQLPPPPPPPYPPPPPNGGSGGQTTAHRSSDHHSQHHSQSQQQQQQQQQLKSPQKQRHSPRATSTRGAVEHYNNRKTNRKNGHNYSESGGGGWHDGPNGGRKRGRSSSFNHDGGRSSNDVGRGGGGRYRGFGNDRSGPNNRGSSDYNSDRPGPNNRGSNSGNAGNGARTRYQQPRQHLHNTEGEDVNNKKGEGQGDTTTGSPSHHHNRPTHNQHHHRHGRRPNYDSHNNNSNNSNNSNNQSPPGVPQSNNRMPNRTESSPPTSSGFGNINVSIPPPPPFPPPSKDGEDTARNRHRHRHHHASPSARTSPDKRGRGARGDPTERSERTAPAANGSDGGGAGADPTRTLLLSGVPPYVTEHDVRQYFTHEWEVHVTSVTIVPAVRGGVVEDGEGGGTVVPDPPVAAGGEGPGPVTATGTTAPGVEEDDGLWYEAHVELSTRREAYSIANYTWKPWDALILGIDSIDIEGVLRDHPRYRSGDANGGGPQLPTPIVRRPPPTEQQRNLHRRHGELRTGLQTLRDKKKELEQREKILGQQLKIHQRMLSMMKDKGTSNDVAAVSYRAKKTKEILEKVTGVRNMVLSVRKEVLNEIDPEIKKLESEEEALRLELQTAVALAAKSSTARPFQLDRRTTVLRVDGLGKDTPLEDVRVHFSGYGAVTNVEWLLHESDQEKHEEADEESPSGVTAALPLPTLLVHCVNRGVAERIRANCRQYNGEDLTFAWHCGTTEKPLGAAVGKGTSVTIGSGGGAVLEDVTAMENSVVEVDGGGGGGDGTGDKSLYWTEDDDLMVDYDDEEG